MATTPALTASGRDAHTSGISRRSGRLQGSGVASLWCHIFDTMRHTGMAENRLRCPERCKSAESKCRSGWRNRLDSKLRWIHDAGGWRPAPVGTASPLKVSAIALRSGGANKVVVFACVRCENLHGTGGVSRKRRYARVARGRWKNENLRPDWV